MKYVSLLALLVSTPALAAEHTLTGAEIKSVLTDQVLTAGTDISQIFQKSGATFYAEGSNQSQGLWQVRGDKYCSQWPPGQTWSCYDVVQDGATVTFVSSDGKRFEMQLPKAN